MSIVFVVEETKETLHATDEDGMPWIRVGIPKRVTIECWICEQEINEEQGHAWYSVYEAELHCRNCITRSQ